MRKELDLRSRRPGKRVGWLCAFYVPAVVILLAGSCITGAIHLKNHTLKQQIAILETWLAETEPQFTQAERKWTYNEALIQRCQSVDDLTKALATYPAVTSDLIARIAAVGGEKVTMTLEGWDADSGVLSFRAESTGVIDIPAYVLALRETGLFRSVDYSGYQYRQEGYILSLRCVLEEGGGL